MAPRNELPEVSTTARVTPGAVSVETMTLEEHDGKTTFTATSVYDMQEQRDQMLQSGMEEGATETMERLDEYLDV